MATQTTNFGLNEPLVNNATDQDLWGGELNTNTSNVDALLLTLLNLTPVSQTATFTASIPTAGSVTTGSSKTIQLCNATSGAIVGNLPTAASSTGMTIAFKKTDSGANTVTVTPNGSDTIEGAATFVLSAQYQYVVLMSNGTSWFITGQTSVAATVVSQPICGGNFSNLIVKYSSSTQITVAVDEAITKTAIGGTPYIVSGLSGGSILTLNIGTTGVNGMDTGSASASTALFVYLIYNPTTKTAALLGTNSGTGATIYPGSNMPSGYTASVKVSSLCLNGSSNFTSFAQFGGAVSIVPVSVSNGANTASIPPDAKFVNGYGHAGAGVAFTVSDASNTIGTINIGTGGATAATYGTWSQIPLTTASNITLGGSYSVMELCGYTLWC